MAGIPSAVKSKLNSVCKSGAEGISKIAPDKNEKQLAKLLGEKVCKDVDKKLLKSIAEALLKQSAKGAKDSPDLPSSLSGTPTMKKPGSKAVSLTIPFPETKFGEFELQVWADPNNLKQGDKGAVLNFKVNLK